MRGAVVMPNGTGKTKRVAVFAQGAKAEEAKAAGADIVGMEDLAAEIKAGKMDFDVVIASPDTMRVVGTLGQILGPRGLMPNPKVGTVTPDVATAVQATPRPARCSSASTRPASCTRTIGRRSFDSRQAAGQPAGADRRAEQGQAGVEQGHLPAQGGGVVDDGRGRPRGRGVDRRRAGRRLDRQYESDWWAAAAATARGPSKTAGGARSLLNRGRRIRSQRRWRSRCRRDPKGFRDSKVAEPGVSKGRKARRHVLM